MVDILADGSFGRDDGIKCHACGSETFLSFDQGQGLCSYDCKNCDEITTVQFEHEETEGYYGDYYEPPFDPDETNQDYDFSDDYEGYDESEPEFDCYMDKSGQCGKAGSEECDWECPYSV